MQEGSSSFFGLFSGPTDGIHKLNLEIMALWRQKYVRNDFSYYDGEGNKKVLALKIQIKIIF